MRLPQMARTFVAIFAMRMATHKVVFTQVLWTQRNQQDKWFYEHNLSWW